jgi:putative sterol carrier protein
MASMRTYDDGCAAAHALDLVGERWAHSLILSFRTTFDPHAADGLNASYELRLGEDVFRAVVTYGRFEIVRGDAERSDATIETDADTLAALVYDARELAEAMRSGDVKIEGDEKAVERFLTLFPLPEPALLPVVGEGRSVPRSHPR